MFQISVSSCSSSPGSWGRARRKSSSSTRQEFDAVEAERYGLVNRVVPRAELETRVRSLAEQVALVPPLTAEAVKASINNMVDLIGQRDSWRYHFMTHQFVSNTPTALDRVEDRQARRHGRSEAGAARVSEPLAACASSTSAHGSPHRSVPAGLLGEQGAEDHEVDDPRRRLHARGSSRQRLFAVLGRGRPRAAERDDRPPHAGGSGSVPPARRDGRCDRRELPARRDGDGWDIRAGISAGAHRNRAHLDVRAGRPVLTARPRPRGSVSARRCWNLTGYPDRPPVRVGVAISDYLTSTRRAPRSALSAANARGDPAR